MGAFFIIILIVIAVSLVASFSNSEKETVTPKSTSSKEQTVGERAKAVLTQQGIPFTVDDDGDLAFEYHFRRYFLSCINESNFFCLTVYFDFDTDDQGREAMLHVANSLHYRMKLVRMVCYADFISFSVESMVFPNADFQQLLRVSLQFLECAYEESQKHFSEFQNAQKQSPSAIGFTAQSSDEKTETATACQSPSIGFNSSRYHD